MAAQLLYLGVDCSQCFQVSTESGDLLAMGATCVRQLALQRFLGMLAILANGVQLDTKRVCHFRACCLAGRQLGRQLIARLRRLLQRRLRLRQLATRSRERLTS